MTAAAERETLLAQQAAAQRAAEEARLREVAAREGAETALTQQRETWQRDLEAERQRARDVETRWHRAERDRTIAGELSGATFVTPEAAAQVRQLLEGRFETRTDATGRVVVQEIGTGRPAADVIREAIASPSFAHFLAPTTGGGTGAQTPVPGSTQQQGAPGARNPFEQQLASQFLGRLQVESPIPGFGPRPTRN